jgi:hypothetical protein
MNKSLEIYFWFIYNIVNQLKKRSMSLYNLFIYWSIFKLKFYNEMQSSDNLQH